MCSKKWEERGLKIDGTYLSHLRFSDVIVIKSDSIEELQEMLGELRTESEKVGLTKLK